MLLIIHDGKIDLIEKTDSEISKEQYDKFLKKDLVLSQKKIKDLNSILEKLFSKWKELEKEDSLDKLDSKVEKAINSILEIFNMAKSQIKAIKIFMRAIMLSRHVDNNSKFLINKFLNLKI